MANKEVNLHIREIILIPETLTIKILNLKDRSFTRCILPNKYWSQEQREGVDMRSHFNKRGFHQERIDKIEGITKRADIQRSHRSKVKNIKNL